MYRKSLEKLHSWKKGSNRKPLIIKGARQVGKTWLMKRFGELAYDKVAYINFDNNQRMENLFSGNYDIDRLLMGLQVESGTGIDAEDTLIIFDEVQEVPRALSSLKYFFENAPQYHIVAAGSLLGVALHSGTSFPVGKVDFLNLYPLNFEEFLLATGRGSLCKLLDEGDKTLISSFRGSYIDALKEYYYVGGMPEAVSDFAEQKDYDSVRLIQRNLLSAYEQDFSKYAPSGIVPRIRMLWNSIPSQLSKENRKFVYGLIKSGARAREYEGALLWLIDCGLVHKVNRLTKPGVPLAAYADLKAFKLYFFDVGLMAAHSGLDRKSILEENRIFEEFKGSLTEQYVLQQLISQGNAEPFYWSAENSSGEVDFVLQINGQVIPLEVKAAENLQAKSLKNYAARYKPEMAYRTSLSDYRKEKWMVNVPLYEIGRQFV